jgi:uncharacterized membrane protein YsdA (DUF1294 family)
MTRAAASSHRPRVQDRPIMLALTFILPWPIVLYLLASIVTFLLYLLDKHKAAHRRWRISEATLHLCEFLGGFPGAFVAQHLLRHKNRKLSYQLAYWLIVLTHALFWAWWFRLIRF